MSYTENEIVAAASMCGWGKSIAQALIGELERENDHVHDFADSDTVTVREIREAWNRRRIDVPIGRCPGIQASELLKDISEHRENFCQDAVVQDPEGNIWKLRGRDWVIFDSMMKIGYDIPRRPLTLLAVDKRRG